MSRREMSGRRRLSVPEVLQSSLMDCGPAALKAVLEGFGIQVGYDALRERCQTDVDGTSIDALAELSRECGLACHRVLMPMDHLLLPEARSLPAIVTVRSSGGAFHFVVVWRRWGSFVQIMDPSSGRKWCSGQQLLGEMPVFTLPVSTAHFRRWARSAPAQAAFGARLRRLGLPRAGAEQLLADAQRDSSWRSIGRLDAALRMTDALVSSGALARGRQARRALLELTSPSGCLDVPARFQWLRPAPEGEHQLLTRGCLILHFTGPSRRRAAVPQRGAVVPPSPTPVPLRSPAAERSTVLPPAALRLLAQASWQPSAVAWALLQGPAGRLLWPAAGTLLLTSLLIPVEALLLRALLDMSDHRSLSYEQLIWMLALLALIAAGLWLEAWTDAALASLGRELEGRVRAALLETLPRLGEAYLRSRPVSDVASRGHSIHVLRRLPILWGLSARSACTVLALVGSLVWLYPQGWWAICGLATASLLAPLWGRRRLTETNLRLYTHSAGLDRFVLDTLLGATPVRVHGAARSIQNAHEELLTHWATSALECHRQQTVTRAAQGLITAAAAAALVAEYLEHTAWAGGLLVLAFLALRVPASADELTSALHALRNLKVLALRAIAPLATSAATASTATAAPSDSPVEQQNVPAALVTAPSPPAPRQRGLHIALADVSVVLGGHALLRDVSLTIQAGQHVAIVGASGAGKSSLVGLLLGLLSPAAGRLEVDGEPLTLERARALRDQIAWVDPAVQLWDQSLLDNLTYGDDQNAEQKLPDALAAAELLDVLSQLTAGLQSGLGESGVRVSGGQGQRVRIGRALMRDEPRLVLLDEPFRGLERQQRQALLARLREHWRGSTLLFVSHDVDDTSDLEHVIVFEAGRVVETGDPRLLLQSRAGHYAKLYGSAQTLRDQVWYGGLFRRLQLERGKVVCSAAHSSTNLEADA